MPRQQAIQTVSGTYRGICLQDLQYVWRTQRYTPFTYAQIAANGFNVVRLAFNANQIQDVPLGSLHAPYVTIIRDNLNWAHENGLKVILDLHDFGRRVVSSVEYRYGDPQLPVSTLADLWTKLVAEFDTHPAVIAYDVMNECHDMPNQASPSTYKTCTVAQIHQQCIDAIRATGSTKIISLAPDNWGNIPNFFAAWSYGSNPDVWWTDPLNNVWFTVHTYFNWINSGIYQGQDRFLNQPTGNNSTWIPHRANLLRTLHAWTAPRGIPIYIGEYNVHGDDGPYLNALEQMFTVANEIGAHMTYWPFFDTDRPGGNLAIIRRNL